MTVPEDKAIEILQRLTRIETILETAAKADETATEALLLSRENSRRLDKVDKIIFWASTTVIGSVLLALLAMLYKTTNEGG
jgi:hypothetical protein